MPYLHLSLYMHPCIFERAKHYDKNYITDRLYLLYRYVYYWIHLWCENSKIYHICHIFGAVKLLPHLCGAK
jgi:hypothetical protein